jgi:hypothetical protein
MVKTWCRNYSGDEKCIVKGIIATCDGCDMYRTENPDEKGNTDHYCAQCGKYFSTYYYRDWVYKKMRKGKKYWFCGYNCQRKWEKGFE